MISTMSARRITSRVALPSAIDGRSRSGVVEMLDRRLAGASAASGIRRSSSRRRRRQRQEDQRQREVEERCGSRRSGAPGRSRAAPCRRPRGRRTRSAASAPTSRNSEIAEQHALCRRGRAQRQADRDQARADVGAEHERHRERGGQARRRRSARSRAARSRRSSGTARSGAPRRSRRRIGSSAETLEHEGEDLAAAKRLAGGDDHAERQDHQRQADDDASDLLHGRVLDRMKAVDAGDEQHRHESGEVEGRGPARRASSRHRPRASPRARRRAR